MLERRVNWNLWFRYVCMWQGAVQTELNQRQVVKLELEIHGLSNRSVASAFVEQMCGEGSVWWNPCQGLNFMFFSEILANITKWIAYAFTPVQKIIRFRIRIFHPCEWTLTVHALTSCVCSSSSVIAMWFRYVISLNYRYRVSPTIALAAHHRVSQIYLNTTKRRWGKEFLWSTKLELFNGRNTVNYFKSENCWTVHHLCNVTEWVLCVMQ